MSPKIQPWQRLWAKVGLDRITAIAVLKNTLPPTAAMLVIQSTRLGQSFDTVGYLPIIVTIILSPSAPRIPYLRLFIFALFTCCIMLCVALLAGYCSSEARRHTTPINGSLNDYNSSAAAVSGVWLVFIIWAAQTYRTYNPHRAKPMVLCTIFIEVSLLTSSHLPDMGSIISFNLQLFEMFLLGFAFSAFTSLFIIPQSSRDVTTKDISKLFSLLQKVTNSDTPFGDENTTGSSAGSGSLADVSRIFAKFQIDVPDAKKDIGYSRFSPKDFKELIYRLRVLVIPLRGFFAVESIRTNLYFAADSSQYDRDNALEDSDEIDAKERWDLMFEQLQQPVSGLGQISEEAINHCRISMQLPGYKKLESSLTREGSTKSEPESEKSSKELPGGSSFISNLEKQISQQRASLRLVLNSLRAQDGPLGSVEHIDKSLPGHMPHAPKASQGRLLFMLYIEYLYNGMLDGLLELVTLCDSRFAHSTKRLQLPGKKQTLKLVRRLIDHHHVEGDLEDIESEIPKLTPTRSRMPESERPKKHGIDMERLSRYLDKPFEIIGSQQSFFGLRVACAVMTVSIVALLGQTQQWFFNRRGMWAIIFIPFSMAPSSGEAKSMLLFRVLGTIAAIPVSLVNWYIVNGVPAGVIVFFFVLVFIEQYFLVKYPQWGSFWRPCLITHAVIVGYSLQAKHTHIAMPPATTADDFPIYLIGPYRCICAMIGVAVAYVWTVFPQPTTANSIMRRRLGQALFGLAEIHSCMHGAISSWATGNQGNIRDSGSRAHKLMKARQRLHVKETALLTVIRDQHRFASFDITITNRGPEHRYVEIANEVDRVLTYLNVVIFVAASFHEHIHRVPRGPSTTGPWETGVNDLLTACKSTARQLAALIHILASSVTNDQPLPPFLEAPEKFAVARKMRELRPDLMDHRHADEEGFKAFAVIEICVAMTTESLDKVLSLVREMVGEVGLAAEFEKDK